MSRLALVLALSLAVLACKKDAAKQDPAPPPVAAPSATTTTGTVAPDGVRTIAIEAGDKGYVPERIVGKPGEKLNLKFTRTVDGECLAELKTPDGKLVALPKGTPVEIAVTVPQAGEVKFACGMDMFFGVIVAEKS
jgi:plastocyanin domain-containing protein